MGRKRLVEPYILGYHDKREYFLGYQLGGYSLGYQKGWKLFVIADIFTAEIRSETFIPQTFRIPKAFHKVAQTVEDELKI